jgi:hypothetical protein
VGGGHRHDAGGLPQARREFLLSRAAVA